MIYICVMQIITTVHLHAGVKKEAAKNAKDNGIKGGLSGLVENLLKEHLKRNKIDWSETLTASVKQEEVTK